MVTICNRFGKLYVFGVFAVFIKLFSRNIPKFKVFIVLYLRPSPYGGGECKLKA